MNSILLALILTGPWRPLPAWEDGDPQPVIDAINDILGDRWLELPASRPLACDGPCTEIQAAAPRVACSDLQERVAAAREGWQDVRSAALALGEAIDQGTDAAQANHARLARAMASTRALLSERELTPTLAVERSWRLAPSELMPGLPGAWPDTGSGFRIVRKTGRILEGRALDVEVVPDGAAMIVKARTAVAPVEYCAGDISYRIEGAATFQRRTTSGTLAVPLPLSTSVALVTGSAETATQALTFPGDL